MTKHRFTLTIWMIAVGTVCLGIVAAGNGQTASPGNGPTSSEASVLSLSSGYSADGSMGGFEAKTIRFFLQRTPEGWQGSMSLDSNTLNFSKFGQMTESTLMTDDRIDVALRPVGKDVVNGRTCYDVIETRFTAPDRKMCMVFPRHPSGTYRLIIGGPAVRHIVLLEADRLEPQLANK